MKPKTFLVILAMTVVACAESSTATTAPGTVSQTTAAPTETTAAPTETTAAPTETTAAPTDQPAAGEIASLDSTLGTVLVDPDRRTIYILTNDNDGESTCYDSCEQNWPPVPAGITAADGLNVTIGSTSRTNGFEQLTINGRPVYLFAGDSAPGDVNGQGVGDVWFVVGGDGEPIS